MRFNCSHAIIVVPVPPKQSTTVPSFLVNLDMTSLGKYTGNVALCTSAYLLVVDADNPSITPWKSLSLNALNDLDPLLPKHIISSTADDITDSTMTGIGFSFFQYIKSLN